MVQFVQNSSIEDLKLHRVHSKLNKITLRNNVYREMNQKKCLRINKSKEMNKTITNI